jgi:hypothetical protein
MAGIAGMAIGQGLGVPGLVVLVALLPRIAAE